MSDLSFNYWLNSRLAKPLPGYAAQMLMMRQNRPMVKDMPTNAKQSAVLILLYLNKNNWELILIERTKDGGAHSGQIALPGGKQEANETAVQTAIREAYEEINLATNDLTILGNLTGLYIPVSNFFVQPVIAVCESKPHLQPSHDEVSRIIYQQIPQLFDRKEWVSLPINKEVVLKVKAYIIESKTILWGATAMILSELEVLWNEYQTEMQIS